MSSPMCHHLDNRDWTALREDVLEPSEPTDDAEPELTDEPESVEREPVVPMADD